MARKIWDPEKKLSAAQTANPAMGTRETVGEGIEEKSLEEKFDEMIRGEYKDVFLDRVARILAMRSGEKRTNSNADKQFRAQ